MNGFLKVDKHTEGSTIDKPETVVTLIAISDIQIIEKGSTSGSFIIMKEGHMGFSVTNSIEELEQAINSFVK